MEITETNSEGLKRELQVKVAAKELNERFDERLDKMRGSVNLKGFRKGKVPLAHIKKLYGRAVMAEVLEQAVRETSDKALKERDERPAEQPAIALPEDQDEIEKVLSGQADLSYVMKFEVIPKFDLTDFSQLKLERLVAEPTDEEVDATLAQIRERNVAFEAEEGREAADGDRVTLDFKGTIDGEAFEGGTGEGMPVVLGQKGVIPGFEEAITGIKPDEERTFDVTFPEDYPAEHLKGKPASFWVKATEVAKPVTPEASDEFAATLGVESLDKLKEMIRENLAGEYRQTARIKLKRELLDELERTHTFELPPSLVEREFNGIWKQLTDSMERAGKTFADEDKSEEETREEYRKIAGRRVRLGLVIGEIGDKNKIEVGQEELRQALAEQARNFPGQEKQVYEFYQKNPEAIADLRAPIFEDKVVDFILELAKPAERKVTKDELVKEAEETAEREAGA